MDDKEFKNLEEAINWVFEELGQKY